MTKSKPQNQGKAWKQSEISKMKKLVDGNTPTDLIAYKLHRSPDAVRSKAHSLDVSLKPVNKSPYNRRKK